MTVCALLKSKYSVKSQTHTHSDSHFITPMLQPFRFPAPQLNPSLLLTSASR